MMRMLLDHKSDFGHKTARRIILVGHKYLDLTKAETRTLLVVLSNEENPDWNFYAKVASHSSTCILIALERETESVLMSMNIYITTRAIPRAMEQKT